MSVTVATYKIKNDFLWSKLSKHLMNFLTGPFEQTPILFGSARVPFRVPFWLEKALPCADPLWVLGPEGSVHSGLRLFGSRFSLNVGFLENTEGSTDLVALQQDMQHGFATHPAWRLTSTNAWPDPIQHGIAVSHFLFKSYRAEGLCVALPETISKTTPEDQWLEDGFPFGKTYFHVLC